MKFAAAHVHSVSFLMVVVAVCDEPGTLTSGMIRLPKGHHGDRL